ncbi:LOW QUALITY PROTEIN: diaminopimelate decarboxylase [Brevundimonas abyssalis TAR-001]|uniref:Diaminopimelate decarboxylase n=1 Tax=Brevundimonas abyssalis TAR-001 TaxID=1391729 RepID=A0A8E0TS90_9CAUL|nr:LOW QUALITY PROTEIN: diaminopimelate decarboxylase [Brevundimonas abyssalis TAR-001]
MNHFEIRDGVMHAEGVSLEAIAAEIGTPAYVYSAATLRRHARVLREALDGHAETTDALIAFAVKANSNLSVLKVLAGEGLGADTVSEGEIRRALAAGIAPEKIVFSGVGKTDTELAFAIRTGVLEINVESAAELDRLIAVAAGLGARPDIVFRVNPRVGSGAHAKITTGAPADKFGAPVEEVMALYARAAASNHVRPVGLACHIGSQITELSPLKAAFAVLRRMTLDLRAQGFEVHRLDFGGGLGVPYFDRPGEADPVDYAAVAAEAARGLDVQLAFEPGRMIAANAGVLLTRVIHVNERPDGMRFLVLDSAMNDLMRPALYDAFHDIRPVRPREGAAGPYDVVGPVCETGDTFAKDRVLPPLEAGDLAAFMTAGAYGATMANEYNSRPLVPEVLVDGDRWAVVRARPSYDEMLAREAVAGWLIP